MFDEPKETIDEGREEALPDEEVFECPDAETSETESAEESELERAQREAGANYDKLVRVYAEFENFKKRIEKEKSEFVKYANESLIRDLLGVLDNLDRASEQGGEGAPPEGFLEGVAMILKQFRDVLEKYGVREIEALEAPFDPNFHEAVMHEVAEEHDENTVIDVFQKGFLLKDRLLRPSMVKVSKKPEKQADAGLTEQE